MKVYKERLDKGEYSGLLEEILAGYQYPSIDEIENIYDFLNPFLEFSCKKLEQILDTSNINSSRIRERYQVSLAEELMNFVLKSLVLEIQIKKIEINSMEINSEKRLLIFLFELMKSKESYDEFFAIYNQLLVMILKRIYYSLNNINLMITRFEKDKEIILRTFNIKNEKIIDISFFLGDSHNNGLAVSEIIFCDKSIIYKPRDNGIAYVASKVLDEISSGDVSPNSFFPLVINQLNYSWEEKIEYISCEKVEEVDEYYFNFGYIAGYVYLLNGTDYHFENLIARKAFPILVDNETLLHPEIYNHLNVPSDYIYNIISTSLFPNPLSKFDLSALSGDEMITNHLMETLINIDNDKIGYIKKNIEFQSQRNIPLIKEEKVVLDESHKINIFKGLERFFETIIKNREYLLSDKSPFKMFKGVKIRVLLKHTMNYHEILMKSTHPDYIKTLKMHQEFIARNLGLLNKNVLKYEIESLSNLDIPYFYTFTDSIDIYTGEDVQSGVKINKNSYERLMERIKEFSINELNTQKELIEEVWPKSKV